MCIRHIKIKSRPWLQSIPDFGSTYLEIVPLCVKVDAVGYPDEHVAVGDAVALGHAHADAVASGVNHGLKVSGGVDPVVDSASGGVGCAREHGQVVTEAVGISGLGSGLSLLRSVMPGVVPIGAGLGGIHQGIANRQLRRSVVLSGLVDEPDHLLPYFQVVCQACVVVFNRRGKVIGGAYHERHGSPFPGAIGGGNFYAPRRYWRR